MEQEILVTFAVEFFGSGKPWEGYFFTYTLLNCRNFKLHVCGTYPRNLMYLINILKYIHTIEHFPTLKKNELNILMQKNLKVSKKKKIQNISEYIYIYM